MISPKIKTTLTEDMAKLGLSGLVSEEVAPTAPERAEELQLDEGAEDPYDGKFVTTELLERIQGLPFENLTEDDCDELLDGLKEKELPEGDDALSDLAEETVRLVIEKKAERKRRFKAGKMSKKKGFQCPEGFRQESGAGATPRCVPAHKAAGGMGKLNREARKKTKWGKTGAGVKSTKKSDRWAGRREGVGESVSPFAAELGAIMEGVDEQVASVRDDLMERIENIFILLGEEFGDASVSEVYGEALEGLLESYEIGRLDESVMDEDEFVAEVSPLVTMMRKSLAKIMDAEELGNV